MAIKIIKPTSEQKKCIEFVPEGELLVRGIPGAGKTTVIIERAIYLQNKGDLATSGPKVLLLTYNKALATYIRQLARFTSEGPVEALTFHQWGSQILSDAGLMNTWNIGKEQENKVAYAKRIIAKFGNPHFPSMKGRSPKEEEFLLIKFLKEEISWIKNNMLISRNEYLGVTRSGRGNQIQVTKIHRETIYDVFEKYQELLKDKNNHDFDDIALNLIKNINKIPKSLLPSHILIDEAQDLTSAQFKGIKLLTAKSITIAADKGQQIYRRNFTWKSVDIDIRGSRNKILSQTFRSTKQIIQLARSLQSKDTALINDDEFLPSKDPEASGPLPEVHISDKPADEIQFITRHIKKIQANLPNDSIAIIAHSNSRLDNFESSLNLSGIGTVRINTEEADFISPGVKLVTFHSSKGLEFDHVIVSGLQDGKMPVKTADLGDDPEAFLATERRKLYVAMTRARLTLILSAMTPVSPFLRELDTKLYKML